jgi:hypothetical protein
MQQQSIKPGVRISSGCYPDHEAALHAASAQSSLYRCDPRLKACGSSRTKKALAMAIANASSQQRWSELNEWLLNSHA